MKAKLCNAKELYLTNIYVDIHFKKHCNLKKKIPEAYTPFLFSFKSVCFRWENKRHVYFMYIFKFFYLTITGKTGLKKYIFSKILSLDHMLSYIKIERVHLLQYQKFIHEIVFLELSFFLVRKAFRNKTFHGMSGLDYEKMKTKQKQKKT